MGTQTATDERPKVLIVDDETTFAEDIAALVSEHLNCAVVGNPASGMKLARERSYDLVLVDIDLQSDRNGIDLLGEIKRENPELPVVMLTKSTEMSHIVESIRAGAFYYVTKGTDLATHEIVHIAKLAIEDARNRRAVKLIDEEMGDVLSALVGDSPAIQKVKRAIVRIAPMDVAVFISGESGTGKELVARAVHALSPKNRQGRFVAVNCAGITATVAESTLFGHEVGTFTDAKRQRIGKMEYARGGTLFLDEVVEMPGDVQPKLLRAVQDHEFERMGGNQIRVFDGRIVSATNQDIDESIADGRFREELYFRLNQYPICVPPLRERKEDIPLIACHLVREQAAKMGRGEVDISQSALDTLTEHDWSRNNVRELLNAIIGAIIRCEGHTIQAQHINSEPFHFSEQSPTYEVASKNARDQFQRAYFSHLLRVTGGNVRAAADLAGIQGPALHRHLRNLGMCADDFRG